MSTEITSHRATEKFSFIYTLTISHDVEEVTSPSRATSKAEDWENYSSALVKRSESHHPSYLIESESTTISDQWYEIGLNPAVAELDLCSLPSDDDSFSQAKPNRYFDKIFFTVACGYLVFVLWWLLGYKNGQLSNVFAFMPHHQKTISQADAEFLEYMKRSLEVIERKQIASITPSQQDFSPIVYVPVYTSNPNIQAQQPTPIPLPPPPPPMTTASTPVAKITNIPVLKTPEDSTALPTPPPVDEATSVRPLKSYTLVGLMELGENPTAMFKGKSGTKRIVVGQKIDDSGWKLEAVQERNVVISRQGQSRTISIGENFSESN